MHLYVPKLEQKIARLQKIAFCSCGFMKPLNYVAQNYLLDSKT